MRIVKKTLLKDVNVFRNGNHKIMKHIIDNQKGNALWFILIAVALLAFLTGFLGRNSGSVDQAGNIEQARIKAAALLRFSKSVETTVQTMMMSGISENDLDFVAISGAHDNTNCSNTECEVFNVEGGGIKYRSPAQILSDTNHTETWHVSTENRVYQFGCDAANNGCTELLLLAKDVPEAVCLQVNKIQGITNPSGAAPQQLEILEGSAYTGSYSTTINAVSLGGTNATNEAPQVKGKSAGCIFEFGSGQNNYFFYQVLIPR